jgi:hypothetical protein
MKQYLLSVYQPDGPIPSDEVLGEIMHELNVLNADMKAAGAWVFSAGLHPPATATVLRPYGGEVMLTDGPFAEGKEHLGGFTVIVAEDLDSALQWGRRLAIATTLPVEVRPFQDGPQP